jgi:TolB-like protein
LILVGAIVFPLIAVGAYVVLKDPGVQPDRRSITSVAVLPLENLSGDPTQEYLADGVTEALIGQIAQIHALRVVSRTSSMAMKGNHTPLPEIARALGVDAVIQGSVLRSGDRVRIDVRLIDGRTDRHLWAHDYEREVRDILKLQSDVARAVGEEIRIQITRGAL